MATLLIEKFGADNFWHFPSDTPEFFLSKFYVNIEVDKFKIIELGGTKRLEYLFSDITYKDSPSGAVETFTNKTDFVNRMVAVGYSGIVQGGSIDQSNLVHKTGIETILGEKTFESGLYLYDQPTGHKIKLITSDQIFSIIDTDDSDKIFISLARGVLTLRGRDLNDASIDRVVTIDMTQITDDRNISIQDMDGIIVLKNSSGDIFLSDDGLQYINKGKISLIDTANGGTYKLSVQDSNITGSVTQYVTNLNNGIIPASTQQGFTGTHNIDGTDYTFENGLLMPS